MIIIVPDSITLNNILVRQETGNQEPPQKNTRHLIQETPNRCDWVIGVSGNVTTPQETEPNIDVMRSWKLDEEVKPPWN